MRFQSSCDSTPEVPHDVILLPVRRVWAIRPQNGMARTTRTPLGSNDVGASAHA
jgi:hypothetical protein